MKKFIWTYSSFLILLPIFYVLHHNNELFGFISFKDSLIALLISSAFVAAIYFISRSAVFTFLLTIFMLYFGVMHDFLKSITNGSIMSSYKLVVPLSLLLVILISWYFKKNPGKSKKFSVYLNLLMLTFIVIEVVNIGVNSVRYSSHHSLIYSGKKICDEFKAPADLDKPDIFFIVFDAYTNNSTLKQYWNFNNDSLTAFLMSKGFFTANESQANYNFTPYSISSTLNMNYLPQEFGTRGNVPSLMLRGVNSMTNNETTCILRKLGYDIRYFIPFNSSIEDIGLYKEFNDFSQKQLYNQTFPKRAEHDIMWNFLARPKTPEDDLAYKNFVRRAADIQRTIDSVKLCGSQTPKFVYAHFMITHQPHLYDSNGNLKKGKSLVQQDDLFDTYTDQVKYANKVIQELVTSIQKTNKKNTIIIIEGDHGFRNFPTDNNASQFPNFNAIYFPNHDYNDLYSKMSPVNTFRIVFNHYFGQNLPLLKDSSVFVKY